MIFGAGILRFPSTNTLFTQSRGENSAAATHSTTRATVAHPRRILGTLTWRRFFPARFTFTRDRVVSESRKRLRRLPPFVVAFPDARGGSAAGCRGRGTDAVTCDELTGRRGAGDTAPPSRSACCRAETGRGPSVSFFGG